MSHVSTIDSIKYGFRLMGYLVAVGLVTMIIFMIGGAMAGTGADPTNPNPGSALVGGLIMLAAFLVFYAGLLGMGYKVLVDGVATAIERADGNGVGDQRAASARSSQIRSDGGATGARPSPPDDDTDDHDNRA